MSDNDKKIKKLELELELISILNEVPLDQQQKKLLSQEKWKKYTKDTLGIKEQLTSMINRLNEPQVFDKLKEMTGPTFKAAGAQSKKILLHGDGTSSILIKINNEMTLWIIERKSNMGKKLGIGIEKIHNKTEVKSFSKFSTVEKIQALKEINPIFDKVVPFVKVQTKILPVIEKAITKENRKGKENKFKSEEIKKITKIEKPEKIKSQIEKSNRIENAPSSLRRPGFSPKK